MAYKQFDRTMSFAELALASSMEKNRSLDLMNNMIIQKGDDKDQ